MNGKGSATVVQQMVGIVLKLWVGLAVVVFFFGDRVLREFLRFSIFNSLVIWAGAMALFLLGGVIMLHLREQ